MDQDNPYKPPEHDDVGGEHSASRHLRDETKPSRWQRGDLLFAAAQQAFFLLFGALLLDGGFVFRVSCITAIGHWIAVLMARGRRPTVPSQLDTLVVKFGFLFLFPLVYAMLLLAARLASLG